MDSNPSKKHLICMQVWSKNTEEAHDFVQMWSRNTSSYLIIFRSRAFLKHVPASKLCRRGGGYITIQVNEARKQMY